MQQSTSITLSLPDDVRKFCAAHDLFADLDLALHIAEQTFGPIQSRQISLEIDPETDEESIAVDLILSLTVDETVRRNSLFAQRWSTSGRPEALSAICILPHIALDSTLSGTARTAITATIAKWRKDNGYP